MRVRLIARVCGYPCSRKGKGVDTCFQSNRARVPQETCQWRAELMHPLDEPDGLEKLITKDTPDRFV